MTTGDPTTGIPSIFGVGNTVDNLVVTELSPVPPPILTTIFSDDFTDIDGKLWQNHNNRYLKIGSGDGTIQNNQGITGEFYNIDLPSFTDGCIATDITLPMNNGIFLGLHSNGSTTIYSYIAATGSFGIQALSGGGGLGSVTLPSSGTFNWKYCIENYTAKVYYNGTLVGERGLTSQDPSTGVASIFGVGNTIDNVVVTAVHTNLAPSISSISAQTINEGATYSASSSFTDSDSSSWTATVDYGDRNGAQPLSMSDKNFSLSHLYKDNGLYTVTVTVTDNQGAIANKTATITVNNVTPSVNSLTITPSPAYINSAVSASASFADAGVLDTHIATWNWGDGTASSAGTVIETNGSGTVTGSHTYTAFGTYTVTLNVEDKDLAITQKTATITVVKQLTALTPAQVYVSRQLPTIRLDLKAEVYIDSTLLSSSEIDSVAPGTNATLESIPFNGFSPVNFPSGSALKVVFYVRNACSGSILNSGNATLYTFPKLVFG